VDVASELASKGSQAIESAIHQMSAVSNNVSEILMEGVIDIYALNLVSSNYTISA
jgi:archaellum biogenesis ATPase FlaH